MAEVGEIVQNPLPTCDNHPSDEVEVYCKDCGQAVCFVCSKNHHYNHDCEGILKMSRELRQQIPETCKKIVDGTLRKMQTELESVRACKRRNRYVYLEEKGSMDKLQEECLNAVKETFKMKTDIFSKQLSMHNEKLKAREEKLIEDIEQLDKHVRVHHKSQLSYGKYEIIEMEEKLQKMTREYKEMNIEDALYLTSSTDETSKEHLEKLYRSLQATFHESTRDDSRFQAIKELISWGEKNDVLLKQQNKPLLLAEEALTKLKCTKLEYKALQFYHADDSWFQATADKIRWENDEICLKCSSEEDSDRMKDLLKQISDMNMHEITFESDETDKYTIALNELISSFPTAFFFEHEDRIGITVLCDSYETSKKVKHKEDVLLGRVNVIQERRRNRFGENAAGNDPTEIHASSRKNRQFMTNASNVSNTQRSTDSNVNSVDFHTREGILVKVYSDSITRLSVDCIVNAANESLMHGGGVAYAISSAAGYAFDKESRAYIREHGKIPVGNCCVTGAGNLPYKCVIHTVGPRWSDYNDKRLCEKDLQQAVEVTFREAVKQGCDSIAVPPMSSGIFGVPPDICIKQYYQAVVSYSKSAVHRVQEIHLVDKDQRMVDNIARKFKEYFSSPLEQCSFEQQRKLNNE